MIWTEKLKRKNAKIVSGIGVIICGIGAVILAFAFVSSVGYSIISQEKYLTDPSIPYNELENATFTIGADEVEAHQDSLLIYVVIGSCVFFMGYAILIAILSVFGSRMKNHIEDCEWSTTSEMEVEYCPICGIKLSEVKE